MFGSYQNIISTYYIAGIIPLDLTLHFFVGMIWTITGLKLKFPFKFVLFGIIALAGLKELIDYSPVNPAGIEEYLGDFLVSLFYISILMLTRKVKRSSDKKESINQWKIYK